MSAFEADRFNHSRTSPRQASFQYNSIRQAVWERISVPELPDVVVYIEALEQRILGHVLERAEVRGPFLLRTADPPLEKAHGHTVTALRRIGKRIAIGFDNDLWRCAFRCDAARLLYGRGLSQVAGRRCAKGRVREPQPVQERGRECAAPALRYTQRRRATPALKSFPKPLA